jgi:predicted dehydrogenase
VKQLKVALIGAGFMGRAHALAYGATRITDGLPAALEPVVIADANGELAASFADQFGIPESASDWRAVIARDDVDIVDICTPPQFHEEIAVAAIAAGKHVFCEKPITNDSTQAFEMARTARDAGVVAQVGFNYRHTPAIAFARNLVAEGALGIPLQIRASYQQDTGFNADPNRWRATKATGGSGAIGDIGSHVIDISETLVGDIVRVAGRLRSFDAGGGWVPEQDRVARDLVDDAGVWVAEFSSGVIGSFSTSFVSSGSKNRIQFALDASKGAVQFDWNDRESLQVSYVDDPADHSGFRTIRTSNRHPDVPWRIAGLGTGYVDVSAVQFAKFVRAIERAGEPGPDFDDAAHVQQVVEAIALAAESDGWVDVPARGAAS